MSPLHIGKILQYKRKFLYEWEILDFFSYTEENAQFYSPEFQISKSKYYLIIWPNHVVNEQDGQSKSYVSLYLHKTNEKILEDFDITYGIKSATNKNEYEGKVKLANSLRVTGSEKFVDRSVLFNNKENLVPLGTLTIYCSIIVHKQLFDARPEKLIDDLKHMFLSKKHSDVIFKFTDDTITAHKSILAARSPVFAAMFSNDMQEKQTGVVNIIDCDLVPFNAFLHYMYTGEGDFSKCDAYQLYKIADKYVVVELMEMCIDYMIQTLSVENIFERYEFAKELDKKRLLLYTQHFFNNNFANIVITETWKSFMIKNPDSANELLKGMAPKIKVV